ncbi:repressor LexA [Litorimonas taeanensis]|uniref:LexA repressor n=1 Tax=Litorimonas taeanensis TaxID=568099 RepID=A0A420WKS6_9PROT|nr:transcriptional repressor LexA [Litorimonas taeanensis]RKQ71618.1 repressor LexA [Litorimonas taeanensis]
MLTQKQKDLLILIDARVKAVGVPPSYDEMKDSLGLASKSGIHRLISALEERGFIRRLPNKARALEVLKLPEDMQDKVVSFTKEKSAPQPANDGTAIPFVGKIAAGLPIMAIEDSYNTMVVPPHMAGNGDHYALEIEGESMKDAGILDGDIVVVKKANTARNNQIVVALVDQDEATLKRLYKSGQTVELIAENPDFETQIYGPDRVEIQGVLVGLLRQY